MIDRLRYILLVMIGRRQDSALPLATFWLIAICIAAWILEIASGGWLINAGAMIDVLAPVQPWRFFTAMFLHSTETIGAGIPSPLHLLVNMYSLYIIGSILEKYFGSRTFLGLYLVSGVGASVLPMGARFLQTSSIGFGGSIGASGAIMGLFAVLIFMFRKMNLPMNQLMIVLAINIAIPFFAPNIDWGGHIAGLISGAILSIGLGLTPIKIPENWTIKKWNRMITFSLIGVFILIEAIVLIVYGPAIMYSVGNFSF